MSLTVPSYSSVALDKNLGRKRPSFNIAQSFIAYDKANENLENTSAGESRQGFALSTLSSTGASPRDLRFAS